MLDTGARLLRSTIPIRRVVADRVEVRVGGDHQLARLEELQPCDQNSMWEGFEPPVIEAECGLVFQLAAYLRGDQRRLPPAPPDQ